MNILIIIKTAKKNGKKKRQENVKRAATALHDIAGGDEEKLAQLSAGLGTQRGLSSADDGPEDEFFDRDMVRVTVLRAIRRGRRQPWRGSNGLWNLMVY